MTITELEALIRELGRRDFEHSYGRNPFNPGSSLGVLWMIGWQEGYAELHGEWPKELPK